MNQTEEGTNSSDQSNVEESFGRVVFRDRFWAGAIKLGINTWSSIELKMFGRSTVEVVPDPGGSEQLVGEFFVLDDGESYQSEIQARSFNWGSYRYAISHYIPSNWPKFRYETIITRWGGFAMEGADGKTVNLNAPISLVVYGHQPRWEVHMCKLTDTKAAQVQVERFPISVPIVYDCWNDWDFYITWSRRGENGERLCSGLIVVMLNGVEVLRVNGDNNYHQNFPPCFQVGVCRPNWCKGPERDPVAGKPIVIYSKDLVVIDLNAKLASF